VRRSGRRIAALAFLTGLAAGAVAARAGPEPVAPGRDGSPPLIPRADFFRPAERAAVRLSPDGGSLAWLADAEGSPNVWIAPAGDLAAASPVTRARGAGVSWFAWAYSGRHIIFAAPEGDPARVQVFVHDLPQARDVPVSLPPAGRVRLAGLSPAHLTTALFAVHARDPASPDLYRVDLETGECRLERLCPPGAAGWFVDRDLVPAFAMRVTDDGGLTWLESGPEGEVEEALRFPPEDALTGLPISIDAARARVFHYDSRGRDRSAVVATQRATGRTRVIAEHPAADAGTVLLDPLTGEVDAVSFSTSRCEWVVVDPALRDDFARLSAADPGDLAIADRSLDDRRWLVSFTSDAAPTRWMMYERGAEPAVTPLFSERPWLDGASLAPMRAVTVTARDGLSLACYVTRPHAAGERGPAPPAQPTVVLVHGGPWARDTWGFSPLHQFLASRGYTVLSVNYRGSAGFGKAFLNAGNADDLIDALDWAVARGITDPARVAIMGASYGGYAALVAAARAPERFRCAVAISPPVDLAAMIEGIPAHLRPVRALFTTRVGDPSTLAGREALDRVSPVSLAGDVRVPVLLAHGLDDPQSPLALADTFVRSASAAGARIVHVTFEDEGHAISRPANRLALVALAEVFLAEHLGGACEPLAEALDQSSASIRAGEVQGLPGRAAGR
jgi:dipeptidyl aminopeptidase/acylaminoacyl peptidase